MENKYQVMVCFIHTLSKLNILLKDEDCCYIEIVKYLDRRFSDDRCTEAVH